jgi:hypothetical protein
MPICKKCNKPFPNHQVIEGKVRTLNSRKYCLECSPFNQHNTKDIIRFPRGIHQTTCIVCKRVYNYDSSRRRGHTRTNCNSCMANKKRHIVKATLVAFLGGKCQKCGYDRCIGALVFHHTDPSKKEFTISGKHALSIDKLKKEVLKCQLMCANCHAEEHDESTRPEAGRRSYKPGALD